MPDQPQDLVELLRQRQPKSQAGTGGSTNDIQWPDLPVSPFLPDPPMLGGGPELAKLFQTLLTRVPSLRGLVKNVQLGPSEDYTARMLSNEQRGGQNIPAHRFPNTGLLGLTNMVNNKITLNPSLGDSPQAGQVLVHELAHVGGGKQRGYEKEPELAEELFIREFGLKDPIPTQEQLDKLLKSFDDLKNNPKYNLKP